MLHYETVDAGTLALLKALQQIEALEGFFLVGGTSLALQIGHRKSIDLDLFVDNRKYEVVLSNIPDHISHLGTPNIFCQTKSVLQLHLNEVKVDFVSYAYDFIGEVIHEDGIKLAAVSDIGAMKLSAITGRSSKKDFVDLYFLLQMYSLPQLFDFYRKKYPDGVDFLVHKSLTYFDDAEAQAMPEMFQPVEWETVKDTIKEAVRRMFL